MRWLPIHHMCKHKRSKTVYLIFRSFGGVAFFRHPRDLRSAFLLYSAYHLVNGRGREHSF